MITALKKKKPTVKIEKFNIIEAPSNSIQPAVKCITQNDTHQQTLEHTKREH